MKYPETSQSRCLRKYDRVFSISHAVSESLAKESGVDDAVVVYNGLPLSEIRLKETHNTQRFRIIQVGALDHEKKGQHVLLEACSTLIRKYGRDKITVDFVGEGNSRCYLESLRDNLGLKGHCSFVGNMKRSWILENLREYDLLVQPSMDSRTWAEGFGNTIIEAMAARVPVLVSNMYGPMEIIQEGRLGYHFMIGDAEDCAEKILHIIRNYGSQDFTPKVDLACSHVRENFSIAKTAANFLSEYRKVLGQNGDGGIRGGVFGDA